MGSGIRNVSNPDGGSSLVNLRVALLEVTLKPGAKFSFFDSRFFRNGSMLIEQISATSITCDPWLLLNPWMWGKNVCGRFWRTKKTYENLWMHHIGAPADPNLWVYHRFPSFSPVFPLEACPIDGAVLQRPTAEHAAFPVGVTQLMFFSSWKARAIAAETVVILIF